MPGKAAFETSTPERARLAPAWHWLPLTLLGVLACDTATRRPPGPDEDVRPPPAATAPADVPTEPPGFASELVSPDADPPAKPSGTASVGRFEPLEHAGAQEVFERLRKSIAAQSAKLHALVLDLESGRALVVHRAQEAVNPASNMKLLTAAAALDLLGPAYTFRTELYGNVDANGHADRLILRGGGDPALTTADVFRLAQSAQAQGLRSVARVEVDQSVFDTPFVPPAFASQPGEWASFRAPISAAAVDGNTVTLNVAPSEAGKAARVWYEPAGVVEAVGSVETRVAGSGDHVAWTLDPSVDPGRPQSKVAGGLGAGMGRQRYTRRLEDPRRAPGYVLVSLLSGLGVEVTGPVALLAPGSGNLPTRLSYVSSAPLSELLLPLGKDSDNFTAEMLFVALSASAPDKAKGPWSTAQGALALKGWLNAGGIPADGLTIANGSGLFDANQLTVETLGLVLARMEARPEVFAEYLSQLSVYGTDGTLRHRMTGSGERSRVRAKTGTLSRVDALSGYVLRTAGVRPLVFSLVVTGGTGGHASIRQALDRAVFEWATACGAP